MRNSSPSASSTKFFAASSPPSRKDRPRYRFEDIGQQGVLATAAALLFPATKPHEFAQPQFIRRLCQRRLADQSMLHARQFALAGPGIRFEKIVGNDQAENRIAEEFKRLVVQIARVVLRAGRHLFVRPRAMGHRLRQQSTVTKLIAQDFLKLIRLLQFGSFHGW